MVLERRLEHGLYGYQVPRATRSARRRSAFKKKVEEETQMCAIDLLAMVAGNMPLETQTSHTSSETSTYGVAVKKDSTFEGNPLMGETKETLNQQSFVSQPHKNPNCNDSMKLVNGMNKPEPLTLLTINSKVNTGKVLNVPIVKDIQQAGVVRLDSNPVRRDNVNLVSRDDDENSSGCTHPSSTKKSYRPVPRIGDRRIRKVLASKYWKVTPKTNGMAKHSKSDAYLKPGYYSRKNYYNRIRSERNYPFKKRKFFDCILLSNSDGGVSSEGMSDSPSKAINADCSRTKQKNKAAASSVANQHTTMFQTADSHVKLRIKSFRVPELFFEIPETATVGSLKRTVLEAVTSILGGGLRVGILHQGKKVRDDSKTLLQTGISQDNHLDALGFSLEPNTSRTNTTTTTTPLCIEDSPLSLPCNTSQHLNRSPLTSGLLQRGKCDTLAEPHTPNIGDFVYSDHDSAPSPTRMVIDKHTADSRALVSVSEINPITLSVVSPHLKSKRLEVAQRRIRRPFSVNEVEALVQAVEKLGTGRWRDVKLRAFDNAKHRTYVDLKDKWKTLVHTAKISPQQRRGEPVPQELLDRVLDAHAYWSQQQAKQQLKLQQPDTCLLS